MKIVMKIGNKKYVLDPEVVEGILASITGGEVLEEKWHSKTEASGHYYTYHVYTPEGGDPLVEMDVLSEGAYQAAKMLGKP